MEATKIKRLKTWYHIFLVLGFFGLIDIIVGVLLRESGGGIPQDGGGLTFMILYAFAYLFGAKVATAFLPFIMIISTTWFIWLGISAVLRRKIKKLEKGSSVVGEAKAEKPVSEN